MELSLYKPNDLENWISKIYKVNEINTAADMSIEYIACLFNIVIRPTQEETRAIWDDEFGIIMINTDYSIERRREAFFHELCHPIKHVGLQHMLPASFMKLQEVQAAHFQLYAALPFFIVEEYIRNYAGTELTQVLIEEFCYSSSFIQQRLDQIQRRIWQAKEDRAWIDRHKPVKQQTEYTDETKRLLNQLKQQTKNKEGRISYG